MYAFSMNLNYIKSLFPKHDKKKIILEESSISSLAPKILTRNEDLEKIQPYLDKLNDTLNAKGINNIALTGGYGSGKSTLLKTFQHWNSKEYNFLNISLAAFNQNKTKENFKSLYDLKIKNGKSKNEAEKEISNEFKETLISNEELEKQLEISILQQIIYKVKPSKLPESRFKRINNIPQWKLFLLIPFGFVVWVSSMILLFKYDFLNSLNPHTWLLDKHLDWSSVFVFLFAFLGIGYFSKLVVELFSNSKINKVNLKGEIEIGDSSNKSILNEHYDEILYYFERNNFNVVVIEDLDRFDNTNIFTKLRELNILLNNADSIRNRSAYKNFGIKFLYAVGDDLFSDKKERVKFFEYIIPVIPFINSSNATDQLKNLIKESDLEENVFPNEFLSDITTFIDDIDMRLLINIFHEFVIYRNILNVDVINGREAELFAIITYKNIDPEDFNKLNNKEGKLYKLIHEKHIYINELILSIEKKITNRNTEIETIKNENVSNKEELDSVYLRSIFLKMPQGAVIDVKNIDTDFQNIIKKQSLNYQNYNYTYRRLEEATLDFVFSEIENEVNPNLTYEERIKNIENKHNNRIELLQNEIEKLKKKIVEIKDSDLKQIFREVDINQYLNDFSNNGLLRNLILEGHINESYNDYISLFHEVSLTKEDKKFERSVKSGISESFDFKLTHVENLIDNHIDLKYFERETILNFDLLNYLGKNYVKYETNYNLIIQLLSNEKEKSIEFIDIYLSDQNRPLQIFIEKLVKNWKEFWSYIYSKSNYTREKEDYYLSLIIIYGKIDDIISSQSNNMLSTAIMEKPYFLSLIKKTEKLNYFGKISKLLEQLNIKFDKLDNPNSDTEELFNYVYENDHYQINADNLWQMIEHKSNINKERFNNSNYTSILESNSTKLIEYIDSEINTYVKDVYLMMEQNTSDDEEIIIKLLNSQYLEDNLKIKIIQKVDAIISDLNKINSIEIKKELLINNKVEAFWKNVLDYYINSEDAINEHLVKFLNYENVYTKLSQENMPRTDESIDYSTFRLKILQCNSISDESYKMLLKASIYTRDSFNYVALNEEKINYLLTNILTTTKSNYDFLKDNFPNKHIQLAEKNFKNILENLTDFLTDDNDILLFLKSNIITDVQKINYVSKLDEKLIIENADIAKKVRDLILHKNHKFKFNFDTLDVIFRNLSSIENKISIINLYWDDLNNENIITLVKTVSLDYEKLFQKGKPTYQDKEYNTILFKNLKAKQLIKKYYPDSWNKNKIRITTNY